MLQERLFEVIWQQLEQAVRAKKIVLISPFLASNQALLRRFIAIPGWHFYALSHKDSTLPTFLRNLALQLNRLSSRLGQLTFEFQQPKPATPRKLAEALADALNLSNLPIRFLALDGLDRLCSWTKQKEDA